MWATEQFGTAHEGYVGAVLDGGAPNSNPPTLTPAAAPTSTRRASGGPTAAI